MMKADGRMFTDFRHLTRKIARYTVPFEHDGNHRLTIRASTILCGCDGTALIVKAIVRIDGE